jgi:hypothetical protein
VAFLAICAIAVAIGMRWSSAHAVLLGDWVEPVPGMEDHVQGFSLREAGVAESIEMATLRYLEWRVDGDALVLAGKSIGNGTSHPFEETYRIVSVEPERLELVDAHGASRLYLRRGRARP